MGDVARNPIVADGALLLALAGAWRVGLPGVTLGVVALGFSRRGRSSPSGIERAD